MKNIIYFSIVVLIATLLTSCSKPDVSSYRENSPVFDLYDYFTGQTRGWGIVQDRGGTLLRQFVVDIDGSITPDGNLVLDESFNWSDGEQSTRVWTIEKSDQHTFSGTAADVVGTAAGSAYGNALHWNYHLNIEVKDKTWKVFLDDWMFLQPDNVLINKTKMSKFGIHLGDITIVFNKI